MSAVPARRGDARARGRRALGLAAALLALVAAGALLADPGARRAGLEPLTPAQVLAALSGDGPEEVQVVVRRARLPRVALAACVGASLAVAGALLQVLLRNPLADPFVLGVSSGAALGAVAGLAAGVTWAGGAHPAASAAGALATALAVLGLARDAEGRLGAERVVLAGVVLSYLLAAGVMWIVSLSPAVEGQRFLFWLMGSFASASGSDALAAGVVLAVALAVAAPAVPALNLVAVSEEHAADSGVAVERVKLAALAAAALLTGGAVAVAGSIGFVGLVVPHGVRLVAGSDARLSVPVSALAGAAFLVAADTCARALGEVPIGVLTASLGGPFFLWLLARRRSA